MLSSLFFLKVCFLSPESRTYVELMFFCRKLELISVNVRSIIEKYYIRQLSVENRTKIHLLLAGYYRKQADPTNKLIWNGNDRHALRELIHHMVLFQWTLGRNFWGGLLLNIFLHATMTEVFERDVFNVRHLMSFQNHLKEIISEIKVPLMRFYFSEIWSICCLEAFLVKPENSGSQFQKFC